MPMGKTQIQQRTQKAKTSTAKIRIAYICSSGAHEYWINLANAISQKCELHLFLPDTVKKSKIPFYLEEKINTHYFKKFKFYDIRNIVSLFRLYREILKLAPNLIHLPGGIVFGLPIIYPLIKLRFPLVISVHEPTPLLMSLYDRLLLKIHMIIADAVIVAGETIKRETNRYWKFSKDKVFVVPFGAYVHYSKLIKSPIKENGNAVLFFGTLSPRKGFEYLIRAEPAVSREIKGLKIIVAGRGFSVYRNMVANSKRFEVYDHYISDEQLCELFQRASLVVLPYIWIHQSGVLFTAYAFGKPVVVTKVGSLPEVVSHGETGLVIEPKSVKALSNAIITLLKNEKMREKMKENIYKRITNEYSWNRIAEIMIDVYYKIIKQKLS
jgi:glycosyltransferase involved in cell wall biosynthesis